MNSKAYTIVANRRSKMSLWALIPFLVISFGLAWGILGLYVFMGDYMSLVFGRLTGNHPLFFIAVYSPAIAAFCIVFKNSGLYGLRCFLGRALLWRCSGAWYAFLLLGVPLIFILGSVLRGNFLTEPLPFSTLAGGIAALTLAAIKGPVEEFGWRGLALPLLQRKFVPFWAGLSLGVVWALWHLPAFILSGTQQSEWSFGAFFVGCLAISIIANSTLQPIRRQYPSLGILSLFTDEPHLSGCTTLRHLPANCGCLGDCLVESKEYVYKIRFCSGSNTQQETKQFLTSRWWSIPFAPPSLTPCHSSTIAENRI